MAECPPDLAEAAVDACLRRSVLRAEGASLAFRHPLDRRTALARVPGPRAARLSLRAARVLHRTGDGPVPLLDLARLYAAAGHVREGEQGDEEGQGGTGAVLGSLGIAYTRLAFAHWETGDLPQAHAALAEADRTFSDLLDHDPLLWWSMSSDVGLVQTIRGALLTTEGRPEEALEGAAVVVANARQMAELSPALHGRDLAHSLSMQSRYLWEAGRRAEAVGALLEALHLYRQLAEVSPGDRDALPGRIDEAADRLIALDRHTEAVALVEEVLALQRERLAVLGPEPEEAGEAAFTAVHKARHYLRARRGADRLPWGTPAEIDAEAERLVRAADPAGLWHLLRAVPAPDAVRIAHRHGPEHWAPPEDGPGRAAALRLAARSRRPHAVDRAARIAGARAVWRLPRTRGPGAPEPASFAPGQQPVMAWETYRTRNQRGHGPHATRIDVYDLAGRSLLWSADHVGAGTDPVVCLGPDAVLALRAGSLWAQADLVLYRPGGRTEFLSSDPTLMDARMFATAEGFVVLPRGASVALVAERDRPLREVRLADLGLVHGCTTYAVDPTGQRVLLAGDDRLVLTDAGLRPVSARGGWRLPEGHGPVDAAVFLSPDEVVTSASNGGVWLFDQEADRILLTAMSDAPRMDRLFTVPAWRVLGGRAAGEETVHTFDSVDLAPVPLPRPLAGHSGRGPRTVTASPGGRYVVHGAEVHDLGLPLSFAGRLVASLTPADRAALATFLDGGGATPSAVGELLRLVRDLASAA
ncbi:hypothetical protein [Streptomyces sp. NPDC046385]|uniref:tetratricopeptide repeat protein n=1 Tax=Streptomyces sp. NPDC046385 TaxID=3154918 RepID=UPI0033CEE6CB